MPAVHAFDEGNQATAHAVPDALSAVHTGGAVSPVRSVSPEAAHAAIVAAPAAAAKGGPPLMRRSLEDSASLLVLADIGASDALAALNPPAGARPAASPDALHTPAVNSAHTQPAPGAALPSDACGMGNCRGCDSMPSGIESAEDADLFSPSPVSSGAPALGTAELHAGYNSMLGGKLGSSPAQLQRCQGAEAQREVRLLCCPSARCFIETCSSPAYPTRDHKSQRVWRC